MTEWLESLQALLSHSDPYYLLLAVLVTALLESLLLLGLLVPGVAILLSLSLMAAQTDISAWQWWLAGSLGAFIGDGLSFAIGHWAKDSLPRWPVLRHQPQLLQQGHEFVRRYGGWSIAVGRFIGPLRPLIPAVAGALKMPSVQFLWVNALSSLAWGAAYLLPAFLFGHMLHLQGPWLLLCLLAALAVLLLKRQRNKANQEGRD